MEKHGGEQTVCGRAFVGFGFGPIQTGLMLSEAMESGSFGAYTVAEVDQKLVDAVRANGNAVAINVAAGDGIRGKRLSGIRLLNPGVQSGREGLIAAIRESEEMATAVPSVTLYTAGGRASIAAMLAEAAVDERQRILYTAENDNYAAEKLEKEMAAFGGSPEGSGLQILNTVIGKMSGVISSEAEMKELGLAPLVPGFGKCVLVEEFNRILVSRVRLPGFQRGIRVFEEKDNLLPFEEAKLYGHNAIHALLGFLARRRSHAVMSDIRDDHDLLDLARRAFLDESGAALIRKHGGADQADPLFTAAGWSAYAEDLLQRMTNPWLHDRVERIIRDPERKLGWNDRFFGTMRAALTQGITPRAMALGAAAALSFAQEQQRDSSPPGEALGRMWGGEASGTERTECIRLVQEAMNELPGWTS
jgi:mannitol-1-phosphate 5-dehydrogenase